MSNNIFHNQLHSRTLAHIAKFTLVYIWHGPSNNGHTVMLSQLSTVVVSVILTMGTVLISSSTEGGVATYFCDDGYELEGNTSRECLPDGQWSGNETFCKGSYSTLACHWYV